MATVITNLLSAVPFFGKDLVEFVPLENYFITISILPIIGTVNSKASHKIKIRTENERLEKLEISYNFLSIFVGLIDGDGYIAITKTPKGYIRIDLIISLHLRDLELIKYLHSALKVGRINTYPNVDTVKLTISKTDLQTVIFPLLIYHNLYFLTDIRRAQFDKAIFILQNNIKFYSELPDEFIIYNNLPETAEDYCKLPFFKNWIVGFTIAEGSFYIKKGKGICYSLRQRNHKLLFEAFKIVFNTNKQIEIKDGHSKFCVSSIKDIQTVVEFFSFSNLHPIVGYKLSQYNTWINHLRESSRYGKIKLPYFIDLSEASSSKGRKL